MENKLEVGIMVKCNRLSVNCEPVYEVVEVTNSPLYKLPNVTILDNSNIRRLVTDFDIVD